MNTHHLTAFISEEKQPVIRQSIGLIILGFIGVGFIYCLLQTSIAQLFFPFQANGSVLEKNGKHIGSVWVAQSFNHSRYFQSRPSAINYDPTMMGGSNLALSNPDLKQKLLKRQQEFATFNGINIQDAPLDMITASGSGIDPEILPASAQLQIHRIANARQIPAHEVEQLIKTYTKEKQFGFLGVARVNVLQLNLALDALNTNK